MDSQLTKSYQKETNVAMLNAILKISPDYWTPNNPNDLMTVQASY